MAPDGDLSLLLKLDLLLAIFCLILATFWFPDALNGLPPILYIFAGFGLYPSAIILTVDIITSTCPPSDADTSLPAIVPLALPLDQTLDLDPTSGLNLDPAPDVVPDPMPTLNHTANMPTAQDRLYRFYIVEIMFTLAVFGVGLSFNAITASICAYVPGILIMIANRIILSRLSVAATSPPAIVPLVLPLDHAINLNPTSETNLDPAPDVVPGPMPSLPSSHSTKMPPAQHSDLLLLVSWPAAFGFGFFYLGLIITLCVFGGVVLFFFAVCLAVEYLESTPAVAATSPAAIVPLALPLDQALDTNLAPDANVVPDPILDVVPAYDLDPAFHSGPPDTDEPAPDSVLLIPLSEVRISHTPCRLTGLPELHVDPIQLPNQEMVGPDTAFLAFQNRDQTTGKPCIIAGQMPCHQLGYFLQIFFGKEANRRIESQVRVVPVVKTMTVVFMVEDEKRPPFGGAQLPRDVEDWGEEGDLSLKKLRVVLGKPVKKRGVEGV